MGTLMFIGGIEAVPILIGAVATLAVTGGLAGTWRFIKGKKRLPRPTAKSTASAKD